MEEHNWVVIETTAGDLPAEILRGLLEAQGIPVLLSQEGAARAMGISVGPFGQVEILVPDSLAEQARQVLDKYEAGDFENTEEFDPGGDDEAAETPDA
jgi:hypothetical protein